MRPAERLRAYMAHEPLRPILVLFALNAVDEFDTATFNLLGPEIADSFDVGVGTFGAITVLVTLLVPFVSVPVAYLADRRRRMPIAVAGAAAWGSFSLATGLAPALLLLIVFRVGSGFGKVVNEPVHGALIADFYSPNARAKAFGIHALANTIGAVVAALLGGAVAEIAGWRWAFFALALPTFLTLLWAMRLPEPERGRHEVKAIGTTPPLRDTARRLWAIRSLRYQWIGLAFTSGSILGISVLVPFFLEEEFGVGPGLRGVLLGVGTALAAVAVLVGTKMVQDHLNDRPSEALRLLCRAGILAGVCLFVLAGAPNLWLVAILIWTIMCVFGFVAPGLRAIVTVVAPPEIRATAFALAGLVALAGGGFSLVGFAVGGSNVRLAVALMAPVFLRGVQHFFHAIRYLDDDVARLRPGHVERAAAGPRGGADVLLEVAGITASYDGVQVLFGVDLDVCEGEIVALLGTNGAGKSTALNTISGLMEADSGNIWFAGEPIVGFAPERTVQRGIVQVPGGRGVFPGLTVAENLEMGAFLLRKDRARRAARMEDVLTLFPRLAERRLQRAASLSGGERQMLTLAQSFLLEPRLLLVDELSLGLAPNVVEELLDAVRTMNARGVSVVLVEQSVNVALTLAHRAYFLEKGQVRFSGPTSELFDRPDLLRSVFLQGAGAALR
jgi:ABC-type branched-subunit amino acid transport system ATPase component/predicted MFS family arabinose efflux permease